MLNTNDLIGSQLKAEQYDWIENELRNNSCQWTIVAMHNPMYGVGQWGADSSKNGPSLALRSQLQGLFAQYGVDLVLQGHDHTVSKTYPLNQEGIPQTEIHDLNGGINYLLNPNGVIYLSNGTSGSQTSKPYILNQSNRDFYTYTGNSKKSMWGEFVVASNVMTIKVKYCDGATVKTYQEWGIKKVRKPTCRG